MRRLSDLCVWGIVSGAQIQRLILSVLAGEREGAWTERNKK